MKLRLRSLESNQTIKLEVHNSCTLQLLSQTLISQNLSLSPPLRFSLNRKDQLLSDDPLSSLGITSGDLIYFSQNPNSFSSSQSMEEATGSSLSTEHLTPVPDFDEKAVNVGSSSSKEQTVGMDLDDKSIGVRFEPFSSDKQENSVMKSDEGKMDVFNFHLNGRDEHKLLVIAIHAVFVESGFVGVGLRNVAENWSSTSRLVLTYTIPQLSSGSDNVVESVVLKIQTLSSFLNVYGSLSNGGSEMYCARLDPQRFVPSLSLFWGNCDKESDGLSNFSPEKEKGVFEFWKVVKDGLALPLMIDLCEKTSFSLPACFTRLPMELKLKIMELLPGADIAKMACVCTEMRFLSSNTDLWKLKYAEEFGYDTKTHPFNNWKEKFTFFWENHKKRKKEEIKMRQGFHRVFRPFYFPIRRDPAPFVIPGPIIGGRYDYVPGFGAPPLIGDSPSPFRQLRQTFPRSHARWNFSPNCNLGGFNI